MRPDIDQMITGIAPSRGPGISPGARELFEEITSAAAGEPSAAPSPRRARRLGAVRAPRRRWGVTAALAALATVVGLIGPGFLGLGAGPAAAALDVKREGGYYVVTVKDLFANPDVYRKQLRELGLNVSLTLIPASPSLVGQIWEGSVRGEHETAGGTRREDGVETVDSKGCAQPDVHCTIGLRIPVGYRGKLSITLGRQARTGERFKFIAAIDARGEPLHCVACKQKTVDEVRTLLRERGIPDATYATSDGPRTAVPGSWYVHNGVLRAPGSALFEVGPGHEPLNLPGPDLRGECP
ncbi:hypothetical protein JOL79_14040 [Microbispora sp. RL4-1S]|uniref:Uncharacterized protein n=1 Tax=Microbispora oryzae TaxID=2806554 RepID=A0A941AJF8_9ACTN|nr:hypothetical protein [Microbispora oryzae]MBP2704937.1 hypothetical protein [Microbispora oryzae]